MSSRPGCRDRMFRQVFENKPINVRETGPVPPPPLALALRPFPFPFRSALAISNDPRTLSETGFAEVAEAFAQRSLEFDAGLSFGPGDVTSVWSSRAAALHEAGFAESVFGLPDGGGEAGASQLRDAGLRPSCYVGNPASAAASALAASGVRYFTDSGLVLGEKFGEGLDFRSTVRLFEYFGRFRYDEIGDPHEAGGTDVDAWFEGADEKQRRELAIALFNAPVVELDVGGTTLNLFKRYRGDQKPAVTTFAAQTRSLFLDLLEMVSGGVVVETRLGERALIGQPRDSEARGPAAEPILGEHEIIALDEIAGRAEDRLLVTMPGRLLDWMTLRTRLQFEVDETDEMWLVRITGIAGGAVERDRLHGLAFTIPADAPPTAILVEGDSAPLPVKREADPAFKGHHCVFMPWERRPWPTR